MSEQTNGYSSSRRSIGSLIEKTVCKKYGLESDHSEKADAKYSSTGTPVEIKAAKRRISAGSRGTVEGRFAIFEDSHNSLRRRSGYYVFAVYEIHNSNINILKTKRVSSRDLPNFTYNKSKHPGRGVDNREVRFNISQIFG